MPDARGDVPQLVEHLFRREHARLIAGLTRVLGPRHIDLAEDAVGEALQRALRSWPLNGIPDDPAAWLLLVARNRALDTLRRERVERSKEDDLVRWSERRHARSEQEDDTLRLVFACCAPSIPFEARVAFTLRVACGFSTAEIARALLANEAAVAQRLVRARQRLQEDGEPLDALAFDARPERLDAVLEVLYLLFNEGHSATAGDALVRADLVQEAVRLAELVVERAGASAPRVHALLALMRFQGARSDARTHADGTIATLANQDRSRWDQEWLARGWRHFDLASQGDALSAYHVEAAIAALHAGAPAYADTDWRAVLAQYELLAEIQPSDVVALNRAVAIAKVRGVRAALEELDRLTRDVRDAPAKLALYFPFAATRGLFLWHAGDLAGARRETERALELGGSAPERALLERRLFDIARGAPPEPF